MRGEADDPAAGASHRGRLEAVDGGVGERNGGSVRCAATETGEEATEPFGKRQEWTHRFRGFGERDAGEPLGDAAPAAPVEAAVEEAPRPVQAQFDRLAAARAAFPAP